MRRRCGSLSGRAGGVLAGVLFLALLVPGCERNPAEQYGDALINSYERSQKAADEATLNAMNRTVQSYRAANDRYPDSIEDIERMMGAAVDREKYVYDPERGEVRLRD